MGLQGFLANGSRSHICACLNEKEKIGLMENGKRNVVVNKNAGRVSGCVFQGDAVIYNLDGFTERCTGTNTSSGPLSFESVLLLNASVQAVDFQPFVFVGGLNLATFVRSYDFFAKAICGNNTWSVL